MMTQVIQKTADENRAASRLGWGMGLVNIMLLSGLVGLYLVGIGDLGGKNGMERIFAVLVCTSFTATGALIASRRSENPIGWIFLGVMSLYLVDNYSHVYAAYSLTLHPGALPGGLWAAWLYSWLGTISFAALLTFTFLLFPDGHFVSPRWRWVAWFTVAMTVLQVVAQMLNPGPLLDANGRRNPFGVAEAASLLHWLVRNLPALGGAIILLSAISLLMRYQRARGNERLQIQWIALGAALPISLFFLVSLLDPNIGESGRLLDLIFNLLFFFSLLAFPLTITIAILRYRLYDIEVILRRTLVYTTLTGLLALIYFCSVLLFQQVFRLLWGSQSSVAIILSTLSIAALFTPLRRNIQAFIDRRFYRRHYDANQVLQTFSDNLRREVNLEQIDQRLLTTVDEVVQPEVITLWIRKVS